ncbi:MAG: hypothetical protein JWL98_1743, partial [Xanthomonadaceae bacterium]|nr:hypothetical protein [Xanthomonadaceae bacterium]
QHAGLPCADGERPAVPPVPAAGGQQSRRRARHGCGRGVPGRWRSGYGGAGIGVVAIGRCRTCHRNGIAGAGCMGDFVVAHTHAPRDTALGCFPYFLAALYWRDRNGGRAGGAVRAAARIPRRTHAGGVRAGVRRCDVAGDRQSFPRRCRRIRGGDPGGVSEPHCRSAGVAAVLPGDLQPDAVRARLRCPCHCIRATAAGRISSTADSDGWPAAGADTAMRASRCRPVCGHAGDWRR